MDYSKLVSIKGAAEAIGCTSGVLRRAAKQGKVPGAVHVLGRWGFDLEALKGWVPPERKAFGGPKREDGRTAYKVYLTEEEAAKLAQAGFEMTDPREKGRERRAARKAAKAAKAAGAEELHAQAVGGVADEDDPFAQFGLSE